MAEQLRYWLLFQDRCFIPSTRMEAQNHMLNLGSGEPTPSSVLLGHCTHKKRNKNKANSLKEIKSDINSTCEVAPSKRSLVQKDITQLKGRGES